MGLTAGTRFGSYEIAEPIGAGGMGEVYRATDTELKRQVAIKVLPQAFVDDADRLARFQREAEILASLNHTNIAQVYGIERADGQTAIVMELVEGPTLADRIRQGPIPSDEAMGIALQVVAGLEAAHANQIVHRDLKPANVKVRDDGTVKVLDFGISKPIDPSAISGGSPVMTTPAVTQTGVILGTAAYMSPEQARGKFVDERTDVWAFGCLLYEMLTGQPVFGGEDVMLTLARVLDRDADLRSIPATISPAVRHTLKLCLEKDPRRRIADIRDVRLALEGRFESELPRVADAGAETPFARRALPIAAALLVGAGVVGAAAWMLAEEGAPRTVTRFSEPMQQGPGLPSLAISDDGAQIAYTEGSPRQTMIRRLDDFVARPLSEAQVGQAGGLQRQGMCFSPDGGWLAHPAGSAEYRKTPLSGGRGLALADNVTGAAGGCDWADDGFIYFGMQDGIARVAESGGEVELLTMSDRSAIQIIHLDPQVLPGGELVLFSVAEGLLGGVSLALLDLATRETEIVLPSAGLATFAPTDPENRRGYLVYGQDAALFAAPFDIEEREVGPVSPVIDQLFGVSGLNMAAVSATGTLAYVDGDLFAGGSSGLVWVDRRGSRQSEVNTQRQWGEVALSPDGRRAAGGMIDIGETILADIWAYDFDREAFSRTTFGGLNGSIVWASDSESIIYETRTGIGQGMPLINSVPIDNSAEPMTIAEITTSAGAPTSISPDGSILIGSASAGVADRDLWALALDEVLAAGEPADQDDFEFFQQTGFNESHASFSPDGRWIAYVSDESGIEQVYVIPYPGPGGRSQVSTDGGRQPRWNPAGGELFYLNGPRMMVADVETTATAFRAGNPRELFEDPLLLGSGGSNAAGFQYGVAPDGQAFLLLRTNGGLGPDQQLRVVENWFEELRPLAPAD